MVFVVKNVVVFIILIDVWATPLKMPLSNYYYFFYGFYIAYPNSYFLSTETEKLRH